jgi:1,4-dihydroxy-2-naphthoate polyprenyltransferase
MATDGFGEVSVFLFFGLVAVVGTTYVQVGRVTASSVVSGVAVGCLACASLVANNLRDMPSDARGGKRTLAVLLGSHRTRLLYLALLATAYARAGLAVLSVPLAARAARPIVRGARGVALVPVPRDTALTELVYAILLAFGLALAGR